MNIKVLKMKMLSSVAFVGLLVFAGVSHAQGAPSSLGMRCQLDMNFPGWPKPGFKPVNVDLKLTPSPYGAPTGVSYVFDEIHDLRVFNRPDLLVFLDGNYYRDRLESNSYMRVSATLCQKIRDKP